MDSKTDLGKCFFYFLVIFTPVYIACISPSLFTPFFEPARVNPDLGGSAQFFFIMMSVGGGIALFFFMRLWTIFSREKPVIYLLAFTTIALFMFVTISYVKRSELLEYTNTELLIMVCTTCLWLFLDLFIHKKRYKNLIQSTKLSFSKIIFYILIIVTPFYIGIIEPLLFAPFLSPAIIDSSIDGNTLNVFIIMSTLSGIVLFLFLKSLARYNEEKALIYLYPLSAAIVLIVLLISYNFEPEALKFINKEISIMVITTILLFWSEALFMTANKKSK